jgi:hypothetical protein
MPFFCLELIFLFADFAVMNIENWSFPKKSLLQLLKRASQVEWANLDLETINNIGDNSSAGINACVEADRKHFY